MNHIVSINYQVWFKGPHVNNKDTPFTQEIPRVRILPPRNWGQRSVKFFIMQNWKGTQNSSNDVKKKKRKKTTTKLEGSKFLTSKP